MFPLYSQCHVSTTLAVRQDEGEGKLIPLRCSHSCFLFIVVEHNPSSTFRKKQCSGGLILEFICTHTCSLFPIKNMIYIR